MHPMRDDESRYVKWIYVMRKVLFGILLLIGFSANAGDIIVDAKISKVATSNDGWKDNFTLAFSSGAGICADQAYVIFPRESAINQDAFNRLYSIALMAFAANKTVRVYAYQSSDCSKASFIEVSN